MKNKITFILLSFLLLNPTVGYSYQGEVFTLSSLTPIEQKSAKAIWNIIIPTGDGTGFFISKNELVTNFHVVDDLTQYNIKKFYLIQEGHSRTLKIKQIKHLSAQYDLAVLEIEGEVSNYLNISEEIPQPDEYLFSISYPVETFALIKKTSNPLFDNDLKYSFFSDHSNLPGASGSPLLNLKGEVVGVLHASSGVNLIHAINIIHLKNLLSEEIKSFENPEDYITHAVEQLKKAANQGNKGAQFRLGFYYDQGVGVKQDYSKAFSWIKKVANQGHAEVQEILGLFYYQGIGVKQDFKEGFNWIEKAANQGYADAQYNVGISYYYGQGAEQDYSKAFNWYQKAANQGLADAQFSLGISYYYGQGVKQDYSKALNWTEEAAFQGYAEAQFELGTLYEKGIGVVKKDLKEAAYWYEEAAEQGHQKAKAQLKRLSTLK